MEEDTAKSIIESEGYQVSNINYIPEGNSHFCFDIVLNDGTPVVARFEKTSRISDIDDKKRDFHYNGLLSLEYLVLINVPSRSKKIAFLFFTTSSY